MDETLQNLVDSFESCIAGPPARRFAYLMRSGDYVGAADIIKEEGFSDKNIQSLIEYYRGMFDGKDVTPVLISKDEIEPVSLSDFEEDNPIKYLVRVGDLLFVAPAYSDRADKSSIRFYHETNNYYLKDVDQVFKLVPNK